MKKEKEVCFVYSHEFKGEFYVKVEDFKEVIERLISIREENRKLKEINESQNEEIQRFKDNAMQDMREITELEIENKKLKHENSYRAGIVDILPKGKGHIAEETIQDLEDRIKKLKEYNRRLKQGNDDLKEQNKELKETIKDHQLYEEKLEHRIIEFEELLHGE